MNLSCTLTYVQELKCTGIDRLKGIEQKNLFNWWKFKYQATKKEEGG